MRRDAQMPARHIDKQRIAFRGPNRCAMTDHPEHEARKPKPQTKAKRRRQRAIEDRDGARRAAARGSAR